VADRALVKHWPAGWRGDDLPIDDECGGRAYEGCSSGIFLVAERNLMLRTMPQARPFGVRLGQAFGCTHPSQLTEILMQIRRDKQAF
jgi:hypothetical protein